MITLNKQVACTPMEKRSVKVEVKSGIATVQQRSELVKLEVVMESADGDFKPGDKVWLNGEAIRHEFASKIYEMDGVNFILVPASLVLIKQAANS